MRAIIEPDQNPCSMALPYNDMRRGTIREPQISRTPERQERSGASVILSSVILVWFSVFGGVLQEILPRIFEMLFSFGELVLLHLNDATILLDLFFTCILQIC